MAVAADIAGKLLGKCFSCKEQKEFNSEKVVPTPKNQSTEIHIGPCFTCGKKVSTIVRKRNVDQTQSISVNMKRSKKVKQEKKKEEPAEQPKVAEAAEQQQSKVEVVVTQQQ